MSHERKAAHAHYRATGPHTEHASHSSHGVHDRPGNDGRHDKHADHGGHNKHADHGRHRKHTGHGEQGRHADHDGHDKHAGHSPAMFRDLFWGSLLLTLPTLIWSELLQRWLGYTAPSFPGSHYVPAVFGTAVFVYGGRVFLIGAWSELRDRLPGMMTLIALAITVAFVFSAAVTVGYDGMPLWWELSTLVTIMLLGHWMEMRSIAQASGALRELAKLLPSAATRLVGGREERVPLDVLTDDDIVLVRPGESMPADGIVRAALMGILIGCASNEPETEEASAMSTRSTAPTYDVVSTRVCTATQHRRHTTRRRPGSSRCSTSWR